MQFSPRDRVFVAENAGALYYTKVHTKDLLMTRNATGTPQITQIWFQIRRDHPSVKVTTFSPNSFLFKISKQFTFTREDIRQG